jgi:[CysO sulfur-carrier protein]-S-L-cysteine hydrolase
MTEKLILKKEQWQAMRRHVSRRSPQEACGLLAGNAGRVEKTFGAPNVDRSPERFHMEPMAQWRAFQRMETAGIELVGIYHSHPNGPDHPSPTDIAEAFYPVVQVIWFRVNGRWQAGGFRIQDGKVHEVVLEVSALE